MATGLVPGNRNADSIEPLLQQYDHLLYPNRSIQTNGISAAILVRPPSPPSIHTHTRILITLDS